MRSITSVFAVAAALVGTPPLAGQELEEAPFSQAFEARELARSRECVETLARAEELDARLAPLAARSQRIQRLVQAIAFEDRTVVDSLGADDPTEVAVREWFAEDLALAERYLETQDEAVTATRTTARERVRAVVQAALDSVQGEARAIIEPTGELPARAANCQGAIFIRNAVLEACATQESPLCGPAAEAGTPGDFRFVDAPADLWDIQQLRPWTDPGRLQVGPDGQVVGARTSGFARFGNVVLSVALEPLLARRTELTADQVARFQAVIDTLGFEFASEEYVFAPALSLRANLEDPLADETHYMLHFGAPDSADVVWTGPAGSGTPVDAGIIPSPGQVQRLAAGEPLSLTAIRQTGEGEATAVYTLELTVVNQARASNALLGYMAAQLSRDLASLLSG